MSNLERGYVMPTVATLKAIADRLELVPLDLVTFPDEDDRQRLVEWITRASTLTRRTPPNPPLVAPDREPDPPSNR